MLSLHICLTFAVFILWSYAIPLSWAWLVFCRLFCHLNNRVLGWGRRPLAAATAAAAKLPCAGVFFLHQEKYTYCLWHDLWGYIMSWWYNVYITYNFVAPPAEIETQQYRCWEYDMICGLSGVIPISQTCSYHLRWVGATLVIQQEMGDLQPTNFI